MLDIGYRTRIKVDAIPINEKDDSTRFRYSIRRPSSTRTCSRVRRSAGYRYRNRDRLDTNTQNRYAFDIWYIYHTSSIQMDFSTVRSRVGCYRTKIDIKIRYLYVTLKKKWTFPYDFVFRYIRQKLSSRAGSSVGYRISDIGYRSWYDAEERKIKYKYRCGFDIR